MGKSTLVKEAIIDAKEIREQITENTKSFLLEEFTPRLKNAIKRSLHTEEYDEEEMEDDVEEMEVGDDEAEEEEEFDEAEGDEEFEDDAEEDLGGEEELELDDEFEEEFDEGDDMEYDDDEEDDEELELEIELDEEFEDDDFEDDEEDSVSDKLDDEDDFEDDLEDDLEESEDIDEDLDMETLKQENKELKSGIRTLSTELKEANLLNAKFNQLYEITTKFNLSPKMKRRVLNSIDEADTVKEVSIAAKAIKSSLIAVKENRKPSKKKIHESASKPVRRTKKPQKSQKEILNEELKKRNQKLAGILQG
jgi:hypothetical protein